MPNNIGAFGENFPYTNTHDLNLDWIIKNTKEMKDFFDTQLVPLIEQKIQEIELNLVISYEAETETLVLTIGGVNNG